jgi:hypothetical protein
LVGNEGVGYQVVLYGATHLNGVVTKACDGFQVVGKLGRVPLKVVLDTILINEDALIKAVEVTVQIADGLIYFF